MCVRILHRNDPTLLALQSPSPHEIGGRTCAAAIIVSALLVSNFRVHGDNIVVQHSKLQAVQSPFMTHARLVQVLQPALPGAAADGSGRDGAPGSIPADLRSLGTNNSVNEAFTWPL